ncbi:MAG: Fic family protein [Kofleriaceae bacterium]
MLVDGAEEVRFDRYTICNLHALLADNLLADPSAAGRLRKIEVGISGTVYQPLAIPQQLDELFDQLLAKAAAIEDPFEQAFFVMVHVPYLEPFEDVNKRVSRLAANIPFIKNNLAPLSFVDVPERDYIDGLLGVYELQRGDLARDVSCGRTSVRASGTPSCATLCHSPTRSVSGIASSSPRSSARSSVTTHRLTRRGFASSRHRSLRPRISTSSSLWPLAS